jgi:hypothetical protein
VSAAELLASLRSQGVSFAEVGGRLKYAGPEAVLTEETLATLREAKPALLEVLAQEELDRCGLARCSRCERIMASHHLTPDRRCEDEWDCILARQLAWRAARAPPPPTRPSERLRRPEAGAFAGEPDDILGSADRLGPGVRKQGTHEGCPSSAGVLMHLPPEHLTPAVRTLARILKPGGRLVVSYRKSRSASETEPDGRLFAPIPPAPSIQPDRPDAAGKSTVDEPIICTMRQRAT